jgi:Tol biopolymer transport system component
LAALGASIAVVAFAQHSPESAQQSAWSLETAPFVFASSASGNADLWLQRGAGASAENLTVHEAQDHAASWFPDGARIAFQSMRDGQHEIYVVSVDGSSVENLTDQMTHTLGLVSTRPRLNLLRLPLMRYLSIY